MKSFKISYNPISERWPFLTLLSMLRNESILDDSSNDVSHLTVAHLSLYLTFEELKNAF